MKQILKTISLLIIISLIMNTVSFAENNPGVDQRSGHKIGEWTIELNLGIIKITYKGIDCDNTPDVICVMKAGVKKPDEKNVGYYHYDYVDEDNIHFGGTLYDYIEIEESDYTTSGFYFFRDTYYCY